MGLSTYFIAHNCNPICVLAGVVIIFIGWSIPVTPLPTFCNASKLFGKAQFTVSVKVIPSQDVSAPGVASYTGNIFKAVPTAS